MAVPHRAAVDAAVGRRLQPDTMTGAVRGRDCADRATAAAGNAEESTAAVVGVGSAERGGTIAVRHAKPGVTATRVATRAVHRGARCGTRLIQEEAARAAIGRRDCTPLDVIDAVGFDTVVAATADGGTADLELGARAAFAVVDAEGDSGRTVHAAERHRLACAEIHAEPIGARHIQIGHAEVARVGGANDAAGAGTGRRGAIAGDRDVTLDADGSAERARVFDVQGTGTHRGDAGVGRRRHAGTGVLGDAVDLAGPRAARPGDFAERGERLGGYN